MSGRSRHILSAPICRSENLRPKRLSDTAVSALLAYSWPGNVRQLQHAVEMAVVLSGDREVLLEADFPLPSIPNPGCCNRRRQFTSRKRVSNFDATVSRFERSILEQALSRCAGNKAKAAEILGMKRTTLLAKLKALNLIGAVDARSVCA